MNAPPVRVVATAGHVDHGKSSLIKALTGTDPDRLREERERGMTIDLGFAHLVLPGGTEVGIVDVPGHEDLVRNMLAGVGSIDAAILVVAADEGPMPQTREHLAILSLLAIQRGVVALTKSDLVDGEWLALVRDDVRRAVAGTPLADAEIVAVSSSRRDGLEDLCAALERALGEVAARRDIGRPRLPIDRAFTMRGAGTVVTGTLVDGSLAVGEEVEILPAGLRARIRGLQTHGRALDSAVPGSRVAVNLTGVDKRELERGMVVVRPGTALASATLGLRLRVLDGAAPVAHGDRLKVHVGTAEVMARVAVLEGDLIAPGQERWARLRLASPVVAQVGDRLVVRRPSPPGTIGGGEIADTAEQRFRRRGDAAADLARRAAPSPSARLLAALDAPRSPSDAAVDAGMSLEEASVAARELIASGDAVGIGDAVVARRSYEEAASRVERVLADGHRRAPLRAAVPRQEVRSAAGWPAKHAALLLEALVAEGRVAERGSGYALPGHRPVLSAEQEAAWRRAREALAAEPLQPPAYAALASGSGISADVLAAVVERGEILRLGDLVFLREAVRDAGSRLVAEMRGSGRLTVSRARDVLGSSRRHVLPLLQFLDDHGLTRRVGDDRVLVLEPEAALARLEQLTGGRRGAE